jgi:protein SCO1/2
MRIGAGLALAAAAVAAGLAGFWLAQQLDRGAPALASGTWLPRARPVGEFRLTDQSGRPFTRHELEGQPALVYFGFTRCPDVCPTTLEKLARVIRAAPLPDLRVVFVSVDPQRDPPPTVGLYVHAFDSGFIGLTGDPKVLTGLAANFGVALNRVELPGGDYTMDHTAAVFLLDREARIRAIFTPPFDVSALVADLKRAAPSLGSKRGGR